MQILLLEFMALFALAKSTLYNSNKNIYNKKGRYFY